MGAKRRQLLDSSTRWRIRVPTERLPALARDERFRQVLLLGRLLNSLRFLQLGYLNSVSIETPAGSRQRIGAVFFVAAVLFEGFKLLQNMRKHFRKSAAWDKAVAPILRDREFETLFSGSLKPLRNQAVFHFFEDSFQEPLQRCDLDDLVVVTGHGEKQIEVYYELSDLMTIELFTEPCASADEQLQRTGQLLEQTVDLRLRVIGAGESVVVEYCVAQGFVWEVRDSDGSWRAV